MLLYTASRVKAGQAVEIAALRGTLPGPTMQAVTIISASDKAKKALKPS